MTDLNRVDLNLLVAFEALYEERGVTRAAQRLNLAQPSVSGALARLRTLFDDPLFVRAPNGMQPTPKARMLAPRVAAALVRVRDVLAMSEVATPGDFRGRAVSVAMTDYAGLIAAPLLVAAVRREAPGLDLRIRPLHARSVCNDLEAGRLDFAIGGHIAVPPGLVSTTLFDERFVGIADRAGRFARSRVDLESWLAAPHALFAPGAFAEPSGVVDEALARLGRSRRVALTVPHVSALPACLAGTDLVATIAERIAVRLAESAGVAVFALPLEDLPPFDVVLAHAPGLERDPVLAWVRQTIMGIAARDIIGAVA